MDDFDRKITRFSDLPKTTFLTAGGVVELQASLSCSQRPSMWVGEIANFIDLVNGKTINMQNFLSNLINNHVLSK